MPRLARWEMIFKDVMNDGLVKTGGLNFNGKNM